MDLWDLYEPVDVLSKLPENFNTDLESKKWLERKSALDSFLQILKDNPRLATNVHYNDIISTLKTILDKDANINVTALAAKCITCIANGLRIKFAIFVRDVVPVIFEKFKEKKPLLKDNLIECIDAVYATTNLETIAEDIIAASLRPNPNIKIQLDSFLYRAFKRLKPTEVPKKFLKDFIPTLIKHASESDPEVREAASSALGAIMKCVGPQATNVLFGAFTSDKLKMAKVEEFCAKATEDAELEAKEQQATQAKSSAAPSSAGSSSLSKTATTVSSVVEKGVDSWDLIDSVDILPKLPSSFRTDLESKKWLERKSALESLLQLLTDNPRLCTKAHYGEIIQSLSNVLDKDSNINVTSVAAKCLMGFAKGLRKDFNSHSRSVITIIFAKFKEKKPVLRDPLVECVDAVYSTTNLEAIYEDILEAAKKPNPDIKIQLNLFLYRNIKHLKTTEVPKKFLKEFIPILIKHTSDSDPEVRNASCSALGSIMKCVGQKSAIALFGDLASDKSKMSKIEEFYNKALADASPEVVNAMVQSIHKPDTSAEKKQTSSDVKVTEEVQEDTDLSENSLKPKRKTGDEEEKLEVKPPQPQKQEEKPKDLEEPVSLLKVNSDRAGRMKDERAHKFLKWNFDLPTTEHVQQLTTQLTDAAKPALSSQLLSKDFKLHIKAIDYLQQLLSTDSTAIINNIDLILKWATLRFFDTNPAVLIRLLEFVASAFAIMDDQNESLHDFEMSSFLPYLLLKSGDTKDVIRNNVRRIVKLMGGISVPGKIFPLLLEGLKTKNSRQKAECLIIVDSFLECMGVNITSTPQATMKVLAACISDRDSSVRNAALNAIVTVYKKIGDRIFSLIGQLNEKEKAMLDERIKRSGRFVNGGPDADRPSTMKERLNQTITVGSTPTRARSSSANRRSLNVLNSEALSTPVGTNVGVLDLTMTMTKTSSSKNRQSMGGASKFQLDPKFFSNDFENVTNLLNNSKLDPFPSNNETLDLNIIQPAVRASTGNHFPKRSESVSSISSLESAEQIDRTVHNLSCLSLSIADEAIAQLLHLLHDSMNRVYILERSELILKTFITQFFHIRSQHFEQLETTGNGNELGEFMRSVCNFLSTLVKDDAIISQISADTMRAFIDSLLCLVTDERLNMINGFRQIFRSLNVIVIRICEFSNPNSCFVALMKLLIKYQSSDPQGRVISLLRKCVFKHIDVLTDPVRHEKLELDVVLDNLYAYYSKFYTESNTDSVKETCRALQSYIQRLVITKRYKILNYLYFYPENNPLTNYIRRCIRALGKSEQLKSENGGDETLNDTTLIVQKVVPEELTNLFNRINDDIFDGCVEELYNFMDVHPEESGNFEQLIGACSYGCLVHRSFFEIRHSRINKEPLQVGECVKRILPIEDRNFIEQQYSLQKKLDSALLSFNGNTTNPVQ